MLSQGLTFVVMSDFQQPFKKCKTTNNINVHIILHVMLLKSEGGWVGLSVMADKTKATAH